MQPKKQNTSEHTKTISKTNKKKKIKILSNPTNDRLKVGGYFKTANDVWSVKMNGEWARFYPPDRKRKYQEGSYVRTKDLNWHFVKNGGLVRVYPIE